MGIVCKSSILLIVGAFYAQSDYLLVCYMLLYAKWTLTAYLKTFKKTLLSNGLLIIFAPNKSVHIYIYEKVFCFANTINSHSKGLFTKW
jgi:hypothetical protein